MNSDIHQGIGKRREIQEMGEVEVFNRLIFFYQFGMQPAFVLFKSEPASIP